MNTVKVALTAVAAGAIAGVLFAPAKGAVTRRKISHKANIYADEIKNSFEDLASTVTETLDTVAGEVKTFRKQMMH
jgi:gas vesicle protein